MKRRLVVTILVILMAMTAALYVLDVTLGGNGPVANVLPTFVIILILAACLMHAVIFPKRSIIYIKLKYTRELKDAFNDSPDAKKELIEAVRSFDKKDYESAAKELMPIKKLAKTDADHKAVGIFLGYSLTEIGLYDEAIFTYEELIRKDIATSTVYSNLGNVHASRDEISAAVECFENAIEINPADRYARHNLAKLYFDQKNYEKSIEYASSALEINKKTYQSATLLAAIYTILGDNEKASEYGDLAIQGGESRSNLSEVLSFYGNAENINK